MEALKDKLTWLWQKVGTRNMLLLLLAGGLFLLSQASGQLSEKEKTVPEQAEEQNKGVSVQEEGMHENSDCEKRLKELLSGVKGVGKAEVMITYANHGEKIVLKDSRSSTESLNETDASGGTRVNISSQKEEETIYEAENTPFVTKEYTAEVSGVLVVCEGGGNAEVAMRIVSATEALFGVPAHRIVVLEMK